MEDKAYSLSFWISILYRHRTSYTVNKLKKYGSLGTSPMVVLIIHQLKIASQEQIGNVLKLDKAAITRIVKKLETEGYVSREMDEVDRRINRVYLTPKASALIPEIENVFKEWNDLVLADIPNESRELLGPLLKQMTDNARRVELPIDELKD